jgi:uroporphyrinogen-III synthase
MSWRVAVTRDEAADGPLCSALRLAGLIPVWCPVLREEPPVDLGPLRSAAAELHSFDWAMFASRRAVEAIAQSRGAPWPAGLRTAAVGARTAAALVQAGATPAPVIADAAGADALWSLLKDRDWRGTRVLLPVVAGGRRALIDSLVAAGADVTVIEAYRMMPRTPRDIAGDWSLASPDAVILASPSTAQALIGAIGAAACRNMKAVVAIGSTTAAAIETAGLQCVVSPAADFAVVARFVADLSRRPQAQATHADG